MFRAENVGGFLDSPYRLLQYISVMLPCKEDRPKFFPAKAVRGVLPLVQTSTLTLKELHQRLSSSTYLLPRQYLLSSLPSPPRHLHFHQQSAVRAHQLSINCLSCHRLLAALQ
ncbi:hypothetical protein J6590_067708 [Homalodisca vitripennis]|nr:hypothetical protein J6590_067708 [Homalodisca vitripennis]